MRVNRAPPSRQGAGFPTRCRKCAAFGTLSRKPHPMKTYLALASCLILSTAALADISVTGEGVVTYAPDQAAVTAEFTSEGKTKEEARARHAADRKTLCEEIEKHGFPADSIKTTRMSINAKYEYLNNAPPRLVGYQVTAALNYTTKELEKLSKMLDEVENSKLDPRMQVQFSSTRLKEITDEARKLAVADGKRKAGLYAEATGGKLGKVKDLSELDASAPASGSFTYGKSKSNTSTGPGEQKITVRVRLNYAGE